MTETRFLYTKALMPYIIVRLLLPPEATSGPLIRLHAKHAFESVPRLRGS